MTALNYDIPEPLHQRAKMAALITGRTLKQFTEDALDAEATRVEKERAAEEKRRRR